MSWIGKSPIGAGTLRGAPRLSEEVARLLARLQSPPNPQQPDPGDDRHRTRTAIPLVFQLSPMPGEVPEELATEMVVVGKDISDRGIGFFHERPIPYRRAILTIEVPGDGPLRMEVDLLWCRFTSQGWYESGGRLRRVVSGSPPIARAG